MKSFNFRNLGLNLSGFKTIVVCLLIFNLLSLAAIYSSSHQSGEFVGKNILCKQLIWIIISWLLLIVFSRIHYRCYYNLSYLLYGLSLISLVLVLFFGKKAMGAQRWLSIFGFNFQPSELSKIIIVIILARFFSSPLKRGLIIDFCLPLSLVVLNAIIISAQPDLGTAIIIIALFFILGLFSHLPKKYFIICLIIGFILSPYFWYSLRNYQRQRLLVFINPNLDPLGAGYTIIQSKIAIGSGKIFGKGFLAGTQNQFNFLPERHTDFIFTVIAEEWGFIGSVFLILIYWLILNKILQRLKQINDNFAYFLSLGISLLFFLHIFINIGMTLGVLPVVGLPLIFLSYGGSNLVIMFILVGIFFNICRQQR